MRPAKRGGGTGCVALSPGPAAGCLAAHRFWGYTFEEISALTTYDLSDGQFDGARCIRANQARVRDPRFEFDGVI